MTIADTHVELEVTFLAPEQGGRAFPPWLGMHHYRPHLRVPPSDEMLGVEFVEGPDGPVPFGSPVLATVRLPYEPAVSYAALQPGANIEILEGAHVVGRGRVVRRQSGAA
jgi:hypothetical protein